MGGKVIKIDAHPYMNKHGYAPRSYLYLYIDWTEGYLERKRAIQLRLNKPQNSCRKIKYDMEPG